MSFQMLFNAHTFDQKRHMESFVADILEKNDLLKHALIILVAVLIGLVFHWMIFWLLKRYQKRKPSVLKEKVLLHLKTSTKFLLPLYFIHFAFYIFKIDSLWHTAMQILIVINFAWVFIACLKVAEDVIKEKFKVKTHHKAKDRKVLTQLRFIKSIASILIITLAISAILWNIPSVRELGKTILTSAGVIGIIVGVAAQKSIANLITGFQIAFTQTIKIDDQLVVEGEFGTVEDITLNYVVIKTWDWRRLVLPLNYFNEKPFVNWSYNSAKLVGTVFFYVDYTFPVAELRKKLLVLLKENPLWDKKVGELWVTKANDSTMELRASFSAKNANDIWDLRCTMREELITYIQEKHPNSLPKLRKMETEK